MTLETLQNYVHFLWLNQFQQISTLLSSTKQVQSKGTSWQKQTWTLGWPLISNLHTSENFSVHHTLLCWIYLRTFVAEITLPMAWRGMQTRFPVAHSALPLVTSSILGPFKVWHLNFNHAIYFIVGANSIYRDENAAASHSITLNDARAL